MNARHIGVVAALLFPACSATMKMTPSNLNPAAEAHLKVEKEAGNTALKIQANHLAPASRLAPGANDYVVWISPLADAASPQNVGSMTVDDNLEGTLSTVTPYEKFEVFVTPETNGNVGKPSGPRVLWAQVK